MNNTLTKLKGQIERLNHKLVIEYNEKDESLKVSHEEYGFLNIFYQEDEDIIQSIREILTEVSENG